MYFKKICILFPLLSVFCLPAAMAQGKTEALEDSKNNEGMVSDDFWRLEDYLPPRNSLWLYGGLDEESGGYYGLSSELGLSPSLRFSFSATRQSYGIETDDMSWGFGGDFNEQFGWGIYQTWWGNRNTLEKKDLRLMLSYFNQGFSSRLSYETGEVELFFEQPNILRIDSIGRDHKATELSLGYSGERWYSEIKHKQHDYISRQPQPRRRLLLGLASSIGLQQARNLADRESSLLLGLQQQSMSYELLYSRVDSAFSSSRYTYVSLYLLKSIGPQLLLGGNIEVPLEDGLLTAGLSLGYMW